MAVKAEFSADTSSFVKEVGKADDALGRFGKNANTLQQQVKGFDSVLSQAGINIGPAAKAIDEVAAASGKTATQLGTMATAGLVVGTAMAAWEFGRAIAGFFKLDEAISSNVAKMLGWGDVRAEVAGAQKDVIDAAFKNSHGVLMTYTEAVKFNTEFHKKRLGVVKETAEADAKVADAWKELTSIGADYAATVAAMNPAHVEQIQHYLEMGVSQGVLATAFGVTALQIKAVEASMKAAAEADKAWLEGMKAAAAEAQLYADILSGVLAKSTKDQADLDAKATAKLTEKTDATAALIRANDKARESEQAVYTTTDAVTQAWITATEKLAALDAQKQGDIDISALQRQASAEYLETLKQDAEATDRETQAFWKARDAVKAKGDAIVEATKQTGVYMNQLHMLVDDPKLAAFFGGGPQGAVATTLYSGGQGGVTPEMAAAMAAGQFINSAGVGAVHNTFNITQPLGTPAAIASAVSGALTPSILQGRKMAGT